MDSGVSESLNYRARWEIAVPMEMLQNIIRISAADAFQYA